MRNGQRPPKNDWTVKYPEEWREFLERFGKDDTFDLLAAQLNWELIKVADCSHGSDFSVWLKNNEPRNEEEWDCLYQACVRGRTCGPYRVATHGKLTFVKGRADKLTLILDSIVAPSPAFPSPESWH